MSGWTGYAIHDGGNNSMAKIHLRCPTAYSLAKCRASVFRPFVWQLAQQLNLHGDVCNDGDGVEVRLLEDPETFLVQLHQHCPPLARIDSVEREPFIWSQLPPSSLSAKARAVP
ncbi:acylphosphatase [Escherichia coli]